jgi:hypothetical protein
MGFSSVYAYQDSSYASECKSALLGMGEFRLKDLCVEGG